MPWRSRRSATNAAGKKADRLGCSHRLVSCWFCERFKANVMGPLADGSVKKPFCRNASEEHQPVRGRGQAFFALASPF